MKRVLITGANRGIGLGLTRAFLSQGDYVFATCRDRQNTAALDTLAEEYQDRLAIIPLDVTVHEQIQSARNSITSLDMLINNAGVLYPSDSFTELTAEDLQKTFSVNTIAPIMMIQAFLPVLEKSDNPAIINITMPTRPLSKVEHVRNYSYIASRYALNGLTRMLALELADSAVTVVALWPGYIKTAMNNMAAEASQMEDAIPITMKTINAITKEHNGLCLLPDGSVYDW